MRVVVDTNIIVSAIIAPAGKPAAIIDAWLEPSVQTISSVFGSQCTARFL